MSQEVQHSLLDQKLNASVLPIPATFIIDKNAKIVWNFVDVDYRKRAEPSDIINALKELKYF